MGRKETKRKPKKWRRRIRRVLFLVILILILTAASVPPERTFDMRLSPFVADRRFDWVGWETNAVLEEADWWLRGRPIPGEKDSPDILQDGAEEVRAFLDRQQSIAELERRIRTEIARLPQSGSSSSFEQSPILPASVTPLEHELEELRRQQEATAPQVQRIVAAQVGQTLADEGLSRSNHGWPPVTFRLNDLPTFLVISPRHEIRTYRGVYLLPDVPETERAELEAAIEDELDVSVNHGKQKHILINQQHEQF